MHYVAQSVRMTKLLLSLIVLGDCSFKELRRVQEPKDWDWQVHRELSCPHQIITSQITKLQNCALMKKERRQHNILSWERLRGWLNPVLKAFVILPNQTVICNCLLGWTSCDYGQLIKGKLFIFLRITCVSFSSCRPFKPCFKGELLISYSQWNVGVPTKWTGKSFKWKSNIRIIKIRSK